MAELSGKKTLVTGVHGFVAAQLSERLVNDGAQVVGLDLRARSGSYLSRCGTLERMEFVTADITDAEAMNSVFEEHQPEVVFHLAAQAEVVEALENPLGTLEANVRGTYVILDCARRAWEDAEGPRALVVASSDKAYGQHQSLPYREDDELLGQYPYDVSKACADMIARGYHAAFGLPVAVTRCANIYGPGDTAFSRIIPGTMRSLLRGERPIIRSDGKPLRDYLYISDAVQAYVRLAEALLDGDAAGEAYNFGTGEPVSVLDIFNEMVEVAGRPDLKPEVRGEASRELRDQFLSSAKAQRELGWRAQVARKEGLVRTYEWYRDNLAAIDE